MIQHTNTSYRDALETMAWLNFHLKVPNNQIFFMPIYGMYKVKRFIMNLKKKMVRS